MNLLFDQRTPAFGHLHADMLQNALSFRRHHQHHRHPSAPPLDQRNFDFNLHKHGRENILKFDRTFQLYLQDIERITHRSLHPLQRNLIKFHLEKYAYKKLSHKESVIHREEFQEKKLKIVADWEEMTGCSWPVYTHPVYVDGKIQRQVGSRYDVHHIIENCYGGDNAAWNVHPAKHPTEHQMQIHRPGGYADRIFIL